MRQYIIKMFDNHIYHLKNGLKHQQEFLSKAAYPDDVIKGIEQMKARIDKAERYKEMFLKKFPNQ